MSCLIDLRTPGGEVNHMKARIYPWHKLPHFWVMASRNANIWVLELKTNVHKTVKMTRIRPLMTILKMTVRADCAVSSYSTTITYVYKGSGPTGWSGGGAGFGSMSATPTAQLPESEIKQTFLSTNLAWLLALKWRAAVLANALLVKVGLCSLQ